MIENGKSTNDLNVIGNSSLRMHMLERVTPSVDQLTTPLGLLTTKGQEFLTGIGLTPAQSADVRRIVREGEVLDLSLLEREAYKNNRDLRVKKDGLLLVGAIGHAYKEATQGFSILRLLQNLQVDLHPHQLAEMLIIPDNYSGQVQQHNNGIPSLTIAEEQMLRDFGPAEAIRYVEERNRWKFVLDFMDQPRNSDDPVKRTVAFLLHYTRPELFSSNPDLVTTVQFIGALEAFAANPKSTHLLAAFEKGKNRFFAKIGR